MKDIETKDELIDYIRQWVAIDEQMKMINHLKKGLVSKYFDCYF